MEVEEGLAPFLAKLVGMDLETGSGVPFWQRPAIKFSYTGFLNVTIF